MGEREPRTVINDEPMSVRQWIAIAMTAGLNALDGIDVLSVSYAAPGIAEEWHVAPGELGWVLAMELMGMAVGSVVLGGVADKIGRRTTILGCLVIMAAGMYGASLTSNVSELLALRLLTGLGIGGMLPAINAAAAEFANNRWRNFAMALMVIGYPIGGAAGGLFVRWLLSQSADWRSIFELGALATLAFIPLVWWLVPETPAFIDRRRGKDALLRVNRVLARLGRKAVSQLSAMDTSDPKSSLLDIFKRDLAKTTLLVTAAYFAHITSFYFIIKWTPKVLVNLGYAPAAAAGVLAYANIGGAIGGAVFGVLATHFNLRLLTAILLLGSFATILAFGLHASDISSLETLILLVGFFANAGIAGLYMLLAQVFPTHLRATGTGFAIGVGRGGAAMAPVLAGYLFEFGYGLAYVAGAMGSGSLLAVLCLLKLRDSRQAQ